MPVCIRLSVLVLCTLACAAAGCRQHAARVEVIEERWPDGPLRARHEVVRDADGQPVNHGLFTHWHDNGNKEYEVVFVDGHKHGVATRYHKNGRPWIEEHYVHGAKHGTCRTWDQSGALRKEEQWQHGEPHGVWTVWNQRGRIKSQGWRGEQEADPDPNPDTDTDPVPDPDAPE